ncbi:30S ribosomal protein S12 methylthiotransferase RimO [bacterium]|nr:30S ribosomal protein S12 methylthiotransferase RimO [bacterium]
MKNIHMISLGCARNLVDSEVMLGLMKKDGYAITGKAEDADVIVVNTCGFIDTAKKESVDTILEAAEYKNSEIGRCQKLVIAGCLAERYPGEIKEAIPEVDLVIGTAGFSKIVEEIDKMNLVDHSTSTDGLEEAARGIRVDHERIKDYDLPRVNTQPFYRAYLKLAEGCAKRCSFCVIPDLRGPLRSRSIENLIKETEELVESGVSEINLIAQDLTDFGRDRKDGANLAKLLRELVKVNGIEWIRLFYVYPDQLDDEVINLVRDEPKICKYLDVPIQHINNGILANMNRKTDGAQIIAMVEKLKATIPNLVLRTSLMVGFPGETEESFQELSDFVAQGHLDQVGIFTYSHEEGSKSAKLFDDDVPQDVKEDRRDRLYQVQQEQLTSKLESWVGKEIPLLVEGFHEETPFLLKARHYGQAPDVDNITMINSGSAETGSYVLGRITEVVGNDLLAEIVTR